MGILQCHTLLCVGHHFVADVFRHGDLFGLVDGLAGIRVYHWLTRCRIDLLDPLAVFVGDVDVDGEVGLVGVVGDGLQSGQVTLLNLAQYVANAGMGVLQGNALLGGRVQHVPDVLRHRPLSLVALGIGVGDAKARTFRVVGDGLERGHVLGGQFRLDMPNAVHHARR